MYKKKYTDFAKGH